MIGKRARRRIVLNDRAAGIDNIEMGFEKAAILVRSNGSQDRRGRRVEQGARERAAVGLEPVWSTHKHESKSACARIRERQASALEALLK
jgi:hypothetical protein